MNQPLVNAISPLLLSLALQVPLGATAQAQPSSDQQAAPAPKDTAGPYTLGLRIGGYGFRDVGGDGRSKWNDCRMHGVGVFGERSFGEHFYLEGGLDYYFAHDGRFMDRRSGLLSLAAGGRMFPDFVLSPYAQIGVGLEVTRVELQGHAGETRALPLAFVGFGVDINAGDHVRLGVNLRTHMMGHFPHDDHAAHTAEGLPDAEMELSAQVQFYAKYRF